MIFHQDGDNVMSYVQELGHALTLHGRIERTDIPKLNDVINWLDPKYLVIIGWQETRWRFLIGKAGEMGVFQFLPSTADLLYAKFKYKYRLPPPHMLKSSSVAGVLYMYAYYSNVLKPEQGVRSISFSDAAVLAYYHNTGKWKPKTTVTQLRNMSSYVNQILQYYELLSLKGIRISGRLLAEYAYELDKEVASYVG